MNPDMYILGNKWTDHAEIFLVKDNGVIRTTYYCWLCFRFIFCLNNGSGLRAVVSSDWSAALWSMEASGLENSLSVDLFFRWGFAVCSKNDKSVLGCKVRKWGMSPRPGRKPALLCIFIFEIVHNLRHEALDTVPVPCPI